MYENKMMSKKKIYKLYGKHMVERYKSLNGLKPWYVGEASGLTGMFNADVFFKRFGDRKPKYSTIANWCVAGMFGITTSGDYKAVWCCEGFLLTSKTRVTIKAGLIYFYKMDENEPYYTKPKNTKRLKDMDEEELNRLYKICADDEDFPKIERIVRRYIRMEIKRQLKKINGG